MDMWNIILELSSKFKCRSNGELISDVEDVFLVVALGLVEGCDHCGWFLVYA